MIPAPPTPMLDDLFHHFAHGQMAGRRRPEVPRVRELNRPAPLAGRQMKISRNRLEYVLPGPDCTGISHRYRLLLRECADTVRDDAVFRPVPTADHVPRPRRREAHAM